jgi:hypothetical protein
MDRVVGKPFHRSGKVWLPTRVDGHRFDVGADKPGEWSTCSMSPSHADWKTGQSLAEAYEREHAAEFAPLFAEAEAFRKSNKQ